MYPASELVYNKNEACAVETRILDSVFISMNSYHERLSKISARLTDMSTRAFGPKPESPSSTAGQSLPPGSVGEIQFAHNRLEEVIASIEESLKGIERIA